MNFKVLRIILKQFAAGLRTIFFVMMCITIVKGQANRSGYTEVAKQRLLIHITANYIFTASQGQIDMDSAMRIPCKVYGLSPLLAYDEGYSDGKPSAGTSLLDAGKLKEARALLTNLNGEARLRLLIELATYFVFKPGTEKADLDEASKYVKEALSLSKTQSTQWQTEAMTIQAHLLDQSGLMDESQKVFADIVTLCDRSGNARAAAQALLSAGRLLHYGAPARLPKFEKALSIFKSLHAKEKEIETLSEINVEYFIANKYDLSEQLIHKIIQLQAQINFHHQQFAYDVLTFLAFREGDVTSAIVYSNKCLESLTSRADSVFISCFYMRRGVLYEFLGNHEKAILWLDKALENRTDQTKLYWYNAFLDKVSELNYTGREKEALLLLKETEKQFPAITSFEKMLFAYWMGKTYEKLNKFDLAENNYKIFLAIADKFPIEYIHNEIPGAYFGISTFYLNIGKIDKARELLEHGLPLGVKPDMARMGIYYLNLFKIDSIQKRYLDAIKDVNLSHKFLDSAFSNEQQKKANELLVKYDAEKKDKNIKLLNSQNQIERVKAEAADRTKNITLAGVVLLLIIIGLLFNRYLVKQRTNSKLEANQRELDQKNTFLETLTTDQQKLLKEKEWLIKEVHHRVKNNLQMVTGLLYSQSVFLEDDAAKLAVKDSLRRMQAMALIHQKLYQDENTSTIAMPEYFSDLVHYLHESFDAGNRIVFEQTIAPLDLDVSQAIPLALIVTESIVNAIKYAFLNGENGMVSISLQRDGTDHLMLKISDNGIGLPAGFDMRELNSLGIDLMRGLTKQLKGEFNIENAKGVHITVRFLILTK